MDKKVFKRGNSPMPQDKLIRFNPYTGEHILPELPVEEEMMMFNPYTGARLCPPPPAKKPEDIYNFDPYTGEAIYHEPAMTYKFDVYTGKPLFFEEKTEEKPVAKAPKAETPKVETKKPEAPKATEKPVNVFDLEPTPKKAPVVKETPVVEEQAESAPAEKTAEMPLQVSNHIQLDFDASELSDGPKMYGPTTRIEKHEPVSNISIDSVALNFELSRFKKLYELGEISKEEFQEIIQKYAN